MERTAVLKKEADFDRKQLSGWAQRTAGKASEEGHIEKVLECGLRRLALAQPSMEKRSASNPSITSGGLSWQPLNNTFRLTCGECPLLARLWPKCSDHKLFEKESSLASWKNIR